MRQVTVDFAKYDRLNEETFYKKKGKVVNVVGLTIESAGPDARLGDICEIVPEGGEKPILAEVVGFKDRKTLLMPYDNVDGIGLGCIVENTGNPLRVPVSEALLGKALNGLGVPVDGTQFDGVPYLVEAAPPDPMSRKIIDSVLPLGVKAVDGLITVGKGQRIGIFAGSGVGKSTLMGMIAKNVTADINVIALVGERGREVLEFVEKDLGPEGMKRSILVVATSDQPAMLRMKCPSVATGIAEYFRDQGYDVLLMMDSLTRFAMAQREIGLAIGEPPVARGYTPSMYAEMPKLLERSGNFSRGSITGVYTVLVEGDDTNEPIADTVRGILDGHIVLSRQLANSNHYPAIDVSASISRLMVEIVPPEHRQLASRIRDIMSVYEKNADLVAIGAYKPGSNRKLDFAMSKIDAVNGFLTQDVNEAFSYEQCVEEMGKLLK